MPKKPSIRNLGTIKTKQKTRPPSPREAARVEQLAWSTDVHAKLFCSRVQMCFVYVLVFQEVSQNEIQREVRTADDGQACDNSAHQRYKRELLRRACNEVAVEVYSMHHIESWCVGVNERRE